MFCAKSKVKNFFFFGVIALKNVKWSKHRASTYRPYASLAGDTLLMILQRPDIALTLWSGLSFYFLDFPQLGTCQNSNLTDFISSRDYEKILKIKLNLSLSVYADLWKTGLFERMSLQTDEDEHSIEMHLPYTAKAMER